MACGGVLGWSGWFDCWLGVVVLGVLVMGIGMAWGWGCGDGVVRVFAVLCVQRSAVVPAVGWGV